MQDPLFKLVIGTSGRVRVGQSGRGASIPHILEDGGCIGPDHDSLPESDMAQDEPPPTPRLPLPRTYHKLAYVLLLRGGGRHQLPSPQLVMHVTLTTSCVWISSINVIILSNTLHNRLTYLSSRVHCRGAASEHEFTASLDDQNANNQRGRTRKT
ncbi:hypothetical protein E2C01_012671 [Portunus trituberculatus]|uniref:Uncharacterized protein n=1 Tax=Portunus trituberculatus TaxID=210409 RepID=A0A5B7DF91_PORTR|nr:hypothetical protein [Portunus trituberculatus]